MGFEKDTCGGMEVEFWLAEMEEFTDMVACIRTLWNARIGHCEIRIPWDCSQHSSR